MAYIERDNRKTILRGSKENWIELLLKQRVGYREEYEYSNRLHENEFLCESGCIRGENERWRNMQRKKMARIISMMGLRSEARETGGSMSRQGLHREGELKPAGGTERIFSTHPI